MLLEVIVTLLPRRSICFFLNVFPYLLFFSFIFKAVKQDPSTNIFSQCMNFGPHEYADFLLSSSSSFFSILDSGIYFQASCSSTSHNTYPQTRASGSVGQEKLSTEPFSYQINGTSGAKSILYSREKRVLDAFDDEYGGVVVDPERLPANPSSFASILHASLSRWKKMVTFLPI